MSLSITDDQMKQLESVQKSIDETLTNEKINGNEEILKQIENCGCGHVVRY